jgi:hypothetical protein
LGYWPGQIILLIELKASEQLNLNRISRQVDLIAPDFYFCEFCVKNLAISITVFLDTPSSNNQKSFSKSCNFIFGRVKTTFWEFTIYVTIFFKNTLDTSEID